MVSKLMSHTSNMESLILRLSEVTEHDDLRFFLMKALRLELDKTPVKVFHVKYRARFFFLADMFLSST
nr:hypothetical protein BaRGS_003457 [Batillaria attramentaria]